MVKFYYHNSYHKWWENDAMIKKDCNKQKDLASNIVTGEVDIYFEYLFHINVIKLQTNDIYHWTKWRTMHNVCFDNKTIYDFNGWKTLTIIEWNIILEFISTDVYTAKILKASNMNLNV